MGDTNPRQYGGADAERILRRAVEIEGRAPAEGFDLAELRAIAAEVGVTPTSVERAVLELLPERGSPLARLAGGPARLRVEEDLDRALAVEDAPRIAEVIGHTLRRTGRLENRREGLVWRASDAYGGVAVTLAPRTDGGTRLSITADRSGAAQLTWILSAVGGLLGAIAAQNHLPGLGPGELLGLWSAAALGAGGVARGIWGRISHDWRERLIDLTGQLRRLPPPSSDGE